MLTPDIDRSGSPVKREGLQQALERIRLQLGVMPDHGIRPRSGRALSPRRLADGAGPMSRQGDWVLPYQVYKP